MEICNYAIETRNKMKEKNGKRKRANNKAIGKEYIIIEKGN